MKMKAIQKALKIISMTGALIGSAQAYDGRIVIVNGQQLTPLEIVQLEQRHGEYIPSGNYWLDHSSGYWGYVGGPAQGILGRPDIEFSADVSQGRADKRWFEDDVADFCARNGC